MTTPAALTVGRASCAVSPDNTTPVSGQNQGDPVRFRLRTLFILVALAALVFCPLGYVVRGIATSMHAESTLHAINLVTVVVDCFIQQENRWPKSWTDLHAVNTVDAPSMYSWPHDAETVKDLLAMEFKTDLATIASQSAEEFDAIRPVGPCYPYDHYGFVDSLIENAKTVVHRQQRTKRQGSAPPNRLEHEANILNLVN